MSKEWTIGFEETHNRHLWLKVFALMCGAMIILAALQSSALVTWSYDLPISPYSQIITQWAEQWHSTMEHLGVASLSETILEIVASLHDDWQISE